MTERRVIEVLDAWRDLERRLAAGPRDASEEAELRARIGELRAEYHRLTAAPAHDDETALPWTEGDDGDDDEADDGDAPNGSPSTPGGAGRGG